MTSYFWLCARSPAELLLSALRRTPHLTFALLAAASLLEMTLGVGSRMGAALAQCIARTASLHPFPIIRTPTHAPIAGSRIASYSFWTCSIAFWRGGYFWSWNNSPVRFFVTITHLLPNLSRSIWELKNKACALITNLNHAFSAKLYLLRIYPTQYSKSFLPLCWCYRMLRQIYIIQCEI